MSRPLRIEYPNAFYHVMNRGTDRQNIYLDKHNKNMFLELLKEISQMYSLEVHAFCLMNNHYHLLLCTPKANLSRCMQHLNGVYSKRYNALNERDGPLFRGRYKAILVQDDEYFLNVSRYIHLNPVEAQMVDQPEDFFWSSYQYFVKSRMVPSYLYIDKTLQYFPTENPKQDYKFFTELGVDKKTSEFYSQNTLRSIYGSVSFIQSMVKEKMPHKEIPEIKRHQLIKITLEKLIHIIVGYFHINTEQLKTGYKTRGDVLHLARSITIYIARCHCGIDLNSIADYFKLKHYSSVSKIVKKFKSSLQRDIELKNIVNHLLDHIAIDKL